MPIYFLVDLKDIFGAKCCIDYFSKLLNKDLDEGLNDKEKAISNCFRILVEESLKWFFLIYKLF